MFRAAVFVLLVAVATAALCPPCHNLMGDAALLARVRSQFCFPDGTTLISTYMLSEAWGAGSVDIFFVNSTLNGFQRMRLGERFTSEAVLSVKYAGNCNTAALSTYATIYEPGPSQLSYDIQLSCSLPDTKQTFNIGDWGELCPVDPCLDITCLNGGVCSTVDGEWTCTCAPDYEGVQCQISLKNCMQDADCLNGGVCRIGFTGWVCKCQTGYTGSRCGVATNPECPVCEARFTQPQLLSDYQDAFCYGGSTEDLLPFAEASTCRMCWYNWAPDNPCALTEYQPAELVYDGVQWPKRGYECDNPSGEPRVIYALRFMGLSQVAAFEATGPILLMRSCDAYGADSDVVPAQYLVDILIPTDANLQRCGDDFLIAYEPRMCHPCNPYTPPCGPHGVCSFPSWTSHTYTCTCDAGYEGVHCETFVPTTTTTTTTTCYRTVYNQCACDLAPLAKTGYSHQDVFVIVLDCQTRAEYTSTVEGSTLWFVDGDPPRYGGTAAAAGLRPLSRLLYSDNNTPYSVFVSCVRRLQGTSFVHTNTTIHVAAGTPVYAVMNRLYRSNIRDEEWDAIYQPDTPTWPPDVPYATDTASWPPDITTNARYLTITYLHPEAPEDSMMHTYTNGNIRAACMGVPGYKSPLCGPDEVPHSTLSYDDAAVLHITTNECYSRPEYNTKQFNGTVFALDTTATPMFKGASSIAGLRTLAGPLRAPDGRLYVPFVSCVVPFLLHDLHSGTVVNVSALGVVYAALVRMYGTLDTSSYVDMPNALDSFTWPPANTSGARYLTAQTISRDALDNSTPTHVYTDCEISQVCKGVHGYVCSDCTRAPTLPNSTEDCAAHSCNVEMCTQYHATCAYNSGTGACRRKVCTDFNTPQACLGALGCVYDKREHKCYTHGQPRPCSTYTTSLCAARCCDWWNYFDPPVCMEEGMSPPCYLFDAQGCVEVGCHWSASENVCSDAEDPQCHTLCDNATCYNRPGCGFHQSRCQPCVIAATTTAASTSLPPSHGTTTTTTTTVQDALLAISYTSIGSAGTVVALAVATSLVAVVLVYSAVAHRLGRK